MSTSMVSTVLEIEREAEAILAKAERDAESCIKEAKKQRQAATESAASERQRIITELETAGEELKARKMQELAATGEAALSAVRSISDAAYESGVQYVMKSLMSK